MLCAVSISRNILMKAARDNFDASLENPVQCPRGYWFQFKVDWE